MSDKKKVLYEEQLKKINELEFSDNSRVKDHITLVNIYCSIKEMSQLNKENIKNLFSLSIEKVKDDDWRFIVDAFPRLLFPKKKKNQCELALYTLLEYAIQTIGENFDRNELNDVIANVSKADAVLALKSYILKLRKSESLNALGDERALGFIYSILIITAYKINKTNLESSFRNIARSIVESYSATNSADPYLIKTISKAISNQKYGSEFFSMSYLYQGLPARLEQLVADTTVLKETISYRDGRISELQKSVEEKNAEIKKLNEKVEYNQTTIAELNNELSNLGDRNEFNENMYEQKFIALKRNLVDSLKKKMTLELQGLEDIADMASDAIKIKLQRRIDNIQKILQKIGE